MKARLAHAALLGALTLVACGGGAVEPLDTEHGGSGSGGKGQSTGGLPSSTDGGAPGSGGLPSSTDGGAPGAGGLPGVGAGAGWGPGTCTDPAPYVEGQDTGYFSCAEGYVHRVEQRDCPYLPSAEELPASNGEAHPDDECSFDTDCPGPGGYCDYASDASGGWKRACFPGCTSDADCSLGSICVCNGRTGQCKSAGTGDGACTTDADCGEGLLCAGASTYFACEDVLRFACQTAADECRIWSDCADGGNCRANGDKWSCVTFSWPYPCGPAL